MCVVCVCTNTFFHNRFLDLSLISRFPVSTLFCPVFYFTLFEKEIEMFCSVSEVCSVAEKQNKMTSTSSNYWNANANATVPKCVTQEPKYGQCPICKVGLDAPEEFEMNYKVDLRNGVMMCHDCSDKEYKKVDRCANCENRVVGGQIVASTWDRKTGKFSVQFCRFC